MILDRVYKHGGIRLQSLAVTDMEGAYAATVVSDVSSVRFTGIGVTPMQALKEAERNAERYTKDPALAAG